MIRRAIISQPGLKKHFDVFPSMYIRTSFVKRTSRRLFPSGALRNGLEKEGSPKISENVTSLRIERMNINNDNDPLIRPTSELGTLTVKEDEELK